MAKGVEIGKHWENHILQVCDDLKKNNNNEEVLKLLSFDVLVLLAFVKVQSGESWSVGALH